MFKAESIKSLDLIQIFSILLLIAIGLAAIYSAAYESEGSLPDLYKKQLVMGIIGLGVFMVVVLIPPRVFYALSHLIFAFSILLLLIVLVINQGPDPARWIKIGSLNFQPSEAAKIALIFTLARFLSEKKKVIKKFSTTIQSLLITALPAALVMIEPDLGTSTVFVFIALPMLFTAGVSILHLMMFGMPVLVLTASISIFSLVPVILIFFFAMLKLKLKPWLIIVLTLINLSIGISGPKIWNSLHPYQQRRIMTFLNPEADPHGAGYQVIQSKIAVGSGGLSGKGFLEGTQSHLRFLPAGHTDFIFSVYSEEFGFIGASTVMLTFFVFVYRGIVNASRCRNKFSTLAMIGISSHFAAHALVNIGMTIGLLPVTGLPLPFLSYGGSSLILNLTMAGVMIGMAVRWREY